MNLTNPSKNLPSEEPWTFWAREWTWTGVNAAFGVRCAIEVYPSRLSLGERPVTSLELSSIADCRIHYDDPLFREYVTHVAIHLTSGDEIRIQIVNPIRPYDVVRNAKEPQVFVELLNALARSTSTTHIEKNPYLRSASRLHIELPENPDGWKPDQSPWQIETRYWPRPWYVVSETLPAAWLPVMLLAGSFICVGLAIGILR